MSVVQWILLAEVLAIIIAIIGFMSRSKTIPRKLFHGRQFTQSSCDLPSYGSVSAGDTATCPKCSSEWILEVDEAHPGDAYFWLLTYVSHPAPCRKGGSWSVL